LGTISAYNNLWQKFFSSQFFRRRRYCEVVMHPERRVEARRLRAAACAWTSEASQ
jgi:hypothetical protein